MNRRAVRGVTLVLSLLSAGCAGGGGLRLSEVTPEAIPSLEAQRASQPGDALVATKLGVAYFKARRYSDARTALDSATTRDPRSGVAAIYLGMTAEQQGDFPAARTAYTNYIRIGRSGTLRNTARQRLGLVGRRELEFQARQALAAESTLTTRPPDANTIAVMPFAYSGNNAQIQMLTRGLAQLLITDLARSRQLRVLERERMQAMLDEMRLGAQGQADPQTAARSGRLLRAERVVQGSLTDVGGNLRVDATVVEVGTAGVTAATPQNDALSRLFDLEKALVYDIFNKLGIQLTEAERAAIEQRPTSNLAAFLAYSRGLEAEDRGDFAAAREAYSEAARADPSFGAAAAGVASSSDLSAASSQSVAEVEVTVTANLGSEDTGGGPPTGDALNGATQGSNGTPTGQQDQGFGNNPPQQRDPTAEVTGTEGERKTTGTIVIIIRRPT